MTFDLQRESTRDRNRADRQQDLRKQLRAASLPGDE